MAPPGNGDVTGSESGDRRHDTGCSNDRIAVSGGNCCSSCPAVAGSDSRDVCGTANGHHDPSSSCGPVRCASIAYCQSDESPIEWRGEALVRWPESLLPMFMSRYLRLNGDTLHFGTSPRQLSGCLQVEAFALRQTATHPHGLSLLLRNGGTMELCVARGADAAAIAAVLTDSGVKGVGTGASGALAQGTCAALAASGSGSFSGGGGDTESGGGVYRGRGGDMMSETESWHRALRLRPANAGQVVDVFVNYFILDIANIVKAGEQTFQIDFYLDMHWRDPRLSDFDADDVHWPSVWSPKVELTNAVVKTVEFDNFLLENGEITHQTRFRATLTASYVDLRAFPFDAQVLNVSLESGAHISSEVRLRMLFPRGSSVASRLLSAGGLAEWQLASISELEQISTLEFDGSRYSNVQICIGVKRRYGYYIKKITITVFLIVAMSWSCNFISPSEIGDRIAISTTLGLTAVAFNFVVSDALPRIPYMTLMDYYLTFCFVAICVSVIENVVVYRVSLFDGSKATSLDSAAFAASSAVTIVATCFFVCVGVCGRRNADSHAVNTLACRSAQVLAFEQRELRGQLEERAPAQPHGDGWQQMREQDVSGAGYVPTAHTSVGLQGRALC